MRPEHNISERRLIGYTNVQSGVGSSVELPEVNFARVPTYIVASSGGDYTTIQAAIDAIGANAGVIYVKKGTYAITNSITFAQSNIDVVGEGPGTRITFDGSVVTGGAFKMADTTQRTNIRIKNLRLSNTGSTGVGIGIDASYFAVSKFEDIIIDGNPLGGILLNATGTLYNYIENCRITVGGSGSYGIKMASAANENTIMRARIAGNASSTGVIVDAHGNSLYDVDVETAVLIGIDVQDDAHDTNIYSPYLEANQTNLQLAANVEGFFCIGGFIGDATTANITDNGAKSPVFISTRLQYEPYTRLVVENDNDERAIDIVSAATTETALRVQSPNNGTDAQSDGRAVFVAKSNGGGNAARIYRTADGASGEPCVEIEEESVTSAQTLLSLTNAGTGTGLQLNNNHSGGGKGIVVAQAGDNPGLDVQSGGFANTSATGIVFVSPKNSSDTANGVHIDNNGTGKGIFVDHDDTGTNPSIDIDRDGNNAAVITGLKINTANIGGAARSLWLEAGYAQIDSYLLSRVLVEANTAASGSPNILAATESATVLTNEGSTAQNYHTLPTAVAGYTFTFICQDSDGIRVVASSGDTIRLANTVSASAGYTETTTIGSSVTLVSINATEWIATSIVGTWDTV